jgi:hypothetical protein
MVSLKHNNSLYFSGDMFRSIDHHQVIYAAKAQNLRYTRLDLESQILRHYGRGIGHSNSDPRDLIP